MRLFARRQMIVLILAFLVPVLAACGGAGSTTQAPTTGAGGAATTAPATTAAATTAPATTAAATTAPATTAATSASTATSGNLSGQLTVAGSSALLPLIQEAANAFQQQHPNVRITVTAGGSGAGRTQVCEGAIDIGNSDVPLSDKERQELNCADAEQFEVALQAFAPVANKTGPGSVTDLTKEQLVGIFTGKITNWSEVGGDDQAIVLINRAQGSGTRANMAKFLFDGDDSRFAAGASEEDNSETVLQTVSQTPGAVSYLGFAYLDNPNIIALSVDGVAPTRENIQARKWPIGGPGYSITKGPPSELEKAFLDYVTGDFQSNPVFDNLGYVPVH